MRSIKFDINYLMQIGNCVYYLLWPLKFQHFVGVVYLDRSIFRPSLSYDYQNKTQLIFHTTVNDLSL